MQPARQNPLFKNKTREKSLYCGFSRELVKKSLFDKLSNANRGGLVRV